MTLQPQSRLRFADFEIDLDPGELWRLGKPVDLAPLPTRVLVLLISSAPQLVDRDRLRREIWGDSWLEWEAGLHQAARRIRLVLGDSASSPRFIETVPRRGYRFIAHLHPRNRSTAVERFEDEPKSRRTRLPTAVLGLAMIVLLGLMSPRPRSVPEMESGAGPVLDSEAIRLLREGVHLIERKDLESAIVKLRRAADLAPTWAEPWSALSQAELLSPGPDRVERARTALEGALARDRTSARAWRQLAQLRLWEEWDWIGARYALGEALRIDPEDAETWQLLGALETVEGDHDSAIEAAYQAIQLDPVSTGLRVDLGWTLYYADRIEEAIVECRRSQQLDPSNPSARQCLIQSMLALDRYADIEEVVSLSLIDRARASSPGSEHDPVEAYFNLQLDLLGQQTDCSSAAARALPMLALGQTGGALEALLAGAEEGRGWEVPFARVDPLFRPLRGEPRFALIESALNLGS